MRWGRRNMLQCTILAGRGLFLSTIHPFMIPPPRPRWPHARTPVCIIFYIFFTTCQDGIKRKRQDDSMPYKSMSYVGIKRRSSNRDMFSLNTVYFFPIIIKWLQALCQGIQGIQGLFTTFLYSFFNFLI